MHSTLLSAVAAVSLATGVTAAGPADLLERAEAPEGFEASSEPAVDIGFDEYADLSPDAVAHVVSGTPTADGMRAAVDVWVRGDDAEILLREVTSWTLDDDAGAFVEQAAGVAVRDGLADLEAPFEGAVARSGFDDDIWTHLVTWQQGPYAVIVTHLAADEQADDTVDDAARAIREELEAIGETEVGRSDATAEPSSSGDASGGGIPIGTVLLWIAIIGGAIFLFVKLRKKMRSVTGAKEPRRADDIIQEARSKARRERGRAAPGEEPPSTDDIIEEARRRARREVEQAKGPDVSNDDWKMPDDY